MSSNESIPIRRVRSVTVTAETDVQGLYIHVDDIAAWEGSEPAKPEAVRLRDELLERAAFEERFKHYNLSTKQDSTDCTVYVDRWVQGARVGWNAAIAATGKQQVGEPKCSDCGTPLLYECTGCSANNYPPQQVGEVQGDGEAEDKLITKLRGMMDHSCGVGGAVVYGTKEAVAEIEKRLAARQPVGPEPIGYRWRHSANEPWQYSNVPCGWEHEALYTAPPAHAVDLGRFREAVNQWKLAAERVIRCKGHGMAEEKVKVRDEAVRLLALIDGQA